MGRLKRGVATRGENKWGIGPTVVALKIEGPWIYGALLNNVWSFAGPSDAPGINKFTMQPFINFNMTGGLYYCFSPVITADWKASGGNQRRKIIYSCDSIGRMPRNPLPSRFQKPV